MKEINTTLTLSPFYTNKKLRRPANNLQAGHRRQTDTKMYVLRTWSLHARSPSVDVHIETKNFGGNITQKLEEK